MSKHWGKIAARLALVALAWTACTTGTPSSTTPSVTHPPSLVTHFTNVSRANCGPGSVPEAGLQGQVPLVMRQSGFKGFSCNMQLLSQYGGQGAEWVGASYKNCYYMSTASGNGETNKGVAVVDMSDPTNIKYVESLDAPAMLNPWESLKVSTKRGLLAGVQGAYYGNGRWFAVYDVSKDCSHPVLQASIELDMPSYGHEGNIAPDGMTYYSTNTRSPDPTLGFKAIDLSKPNDPKEITTWHLPVDEQVHIHGMAISDDGNRGYLMLSPTVPNNSLNGLMIVDLSEIQKRKSNPQVKIISNLSWRDNNVGQMAAIAHIAGRPYIVAVDEGGAGTWNAATNTFASGWPALCDGYPPFAYARLVDISDERVPTTVSKLRLEAQDPLNCPQILKDAKPGTLFGYSSHYCSVDDPSNSTAVACGYFESGIRVFDVRDPYHPKEIAYYNPAANPANANKSAGLFPASAGAYDTDPAVDWASSAVRWYQAADRSWEVWTQTQENGVLALKFTNGAYPLPSGR